MELFHQLIWLGGDHDERFNFISFGVGLGNVYTSKPDINSPEDRERIDRYKRQLEVYAHIVKERTGVPVTKTHLYYTRQQDGVPTITFGKDGHAIERTIRTIDNVVQRIEAKRRLIEPDSPCRRAFTNCLGSSHCNLATYSLGQVCPSFCPS